MFSSRLRKRRSTIANRPRLEILEDRCLLSAGALDSTFGIGGIVTTAVGTGNDNAGDVLLQPDGKIIAVGSGGFNSGSRFALARYTASGSLDTTFGSGGKVTTSNNGPARAAALYPNAGNANDGKILVVGGWGAFALARYKPDGSLDKSFGQAGKVTTDMGNGSEGADGVAIQQDGKIVVVGDLQVTGSDFACVMARYNPNGTLDTTFGTGGKVIMNLANNGSDYFYGVALQADGKIIAVGAGAAVDNAPSSFLVARYNPNGTLDGTFGTGGIVLTPIGTDYYTTGAFSLVMQPDGKIVAAGKGKAGASMDFALVRYNTNGSLDDGSVNDSTPLDSFGSGGIVTTDFGTNVPDMARDVALQPDGKIVAAGIAGYNTGNGTFALVRYNVDGSLDGTFNGTGKVTTTIGAHADAGGVAIQPDGKIVASGGANTGSNTDFALTRYVGDPPLLAASTPAHPRAATLTFAQAQPLLAVAISRWTAAGFDTSALGPIQLQIANLGGRTLAFASGHTITLDDNAAGWGWFVDKTPRSDSEFRTPGNQREQGRMDLLTVLTHEVGHLLGQDHGEGVMDETLSAGTRLMPLAMQFNVLEQLFAADLVGPRRHWRW